MGFGIISYMVLNKGNHPFLNNEYIQNIDTEIFNNIINNEMFIAVPKSINCKDPYSSIVILSGFKFLFLNLNNI